jgi:hypothetical protein
VNIVSTLRRSTLDLYAHAVFARLGRLTFWAEKTAAPESALPQDRRWGFRWEDSRNLLVWAGPVVATLGWESA